MTGLSKQAIIEELTPLVRESAFELVHHASNIDPLDMEKWIRSALGRAPNILDFEAVKNTAYSGHIPESEFISNTLGHFRNFLLPRLNFVTGTDSAKITAHRTGIEPGFPGSASTVAKEKLMMIPPLWADSHIKRGLKLEYLANDMAIEAGYIPRPDLVEKIIANQQGHPFLRGTPDMVLERVLEERESTLILTDYKVPYAAKGQALHDYIMQLHHYTLCNIVGNKSNPDNAVNIQNLMLFEANLKTFKGIETPIAWNQTFAKAILEEGAMVHQHFTQGNVPTIKKVNKYYDMQADPYLKEQMSNVAQLKLATETIAQKMTMHQENIEAYVERTAPEATTRIQHDTLVITATKVPMFTDESRADSVAEYGIEIEGKTNYKIDQEIARKAAELDRDLSVPYTTKFATKFSTKKVDKEVRMGMASNLLPSIEAIPQVNSPKESAIELEMAAMTSVLNKADPTPLVEPAQKQINQASDMNSQQPMNTAAKPVPERVAQEHQVKKDPMKPRFSM